MKFKSKTIEIDGDTFVISEMSAGQRREIFKLFKGEMDPIEVQAKAISMCCNVFKDKSIDEMMEVPGTLFGELADEAMKVSGLADDAEEDATKNS